MNRPSYEDYCQYLLSCQGNYTLTHYAEHVEGLSHDAINRYMAKAQLRPGTLWEQVKEHIVPSDKGFIVFDDTVLDKRYARAIDPVRSQYSGNAHGVINGIGVVTCIYVNPETEQFWAIDWRLFDPERDGKNKIHHVEAMLKHLHEHKKLPYRAVLMDSWYASKRLMLLIERELGKIFYCPLKINRLVDDSQETRPYCAVGNLVWSKREEKEGKTVKIKDCPKDHKVRLFRVLAFPGRTDFIATNDKTCQSSDAVRMTCAVRWKIEQLHREIKQTCGIERCQCRLNRIQRNHIACAFLVWNRLKILAYQTSNTVYQIKQDLLKSYLVNELKSPTVSFVPA
jgi:hypothetical protein